MAYDGRIIFCSKIDNSQIQKDLKQLEGRIKKAQETIIKNQNMKLPLVNQFNELGSTLDAAKVKLEELRKKQIEAAQALKGQDPAAYIEAYANKPQIDLDLEEQTKEVARLQEQWDAMDAKIQKYDLAILQASNDVERWNEKAAELSAQLNSGGTKMTAAFDKARSSADKFGKKVAQIGASMIMFRVFSATLQGISNYMGRVLKTNEEYAAQLAQLKGALLTAFQPL